MKSTSTAAGLLAAFFALAATPASASPGNGVRLGGSEGRLHPYVDLENRWDSNVTYGDQGQAVGDLIVHVRPGFQLAIPSELVAVELGANLDWARYLGSDATAKTDELSKLYAAATLGVSLNRRGAVGLELDDEFRRSASTSAFVFDGAVISNQNALRLKMPFKPGGGALVVALTGGWTLETFEPFQECNTGATALTCDAELLGNLGYNEVRGGSEVRWRFLPRTSAVFDLSYFSRVPNDPDVSTEVSGLETHAGFVGLVTPHLGATVKLGYADTLGSLEETYRTWLATLEAEWLATDSASLRIGWNHGYGIDPGNALSLYTSDRLQAGARYALAGRYGARLEASWERRAYAFADESPNADLLRVEPSLEAAFSRWMNASVGFAYTSRGSSFTDAPGFTYSKNEAWVRLAFTY